MKFAENYDKLNLARIMFESESKKSFSLTQVSESSNFFDYCFSDLLDYFNQIFSYLVTINTKNKVIKNYSAVKDDSVEGYAILKMLTKNVDNIPSKLLTTKAGIDFNEELNLQFTYLLGSDTYKISTLENGFRFSYNDFSGNKRNVLCYKYENNGKPVIVVREKSSKQIENFVLDENKDIVFDAYSRVVNFININNFACNIKTGKIEQNKTSIIKQNKTYSILNFKNNVPISVSESNANLIYNYNSDIESFILNSKQVNLTKQNFSLLQDLEKKLYKLLQTSTNMLNSPEISCFLTNHTNVIK